MSSCWTARVHGIFAIVSVAITVGCIPGNLALACGNSGEGGAGMEPQRGEHRHHRHGQEYGSGFGQPDEQPREDFRSYGPTGSWQPQGPGIGPDGGNSEPTLPHKAPANPGPCAEAASLRAELDHIWQLRQGVAAGRKMFYVGPTINVGRYRREQQQQIILNSANNEEAAAKINAMDNSIARIQQMDLERLDARISEIQNRLGQLDYECQ